MKQLGPEEWKKIVVSVLFLALAVYCHVNFLIKPANKDIAAAEKKILELEAQILNGEKEIKIESNLRSRSVESEEMVAWFGQFSMDGAPIAWFPPMLRKFFERYGIKDVTSRMGGVSGLPASVPHFINVEWSVGLPGTSYRTIGIALSALENEQPLFRITSIQLRPTGDPEIQTTNFGLGTTLKVE